MTRGRVVTPRDRDGARALLWLLAIAAITAVSCFDPEFVSGVTRCFSDGACPDGWICQSVSGEKVCVASGAAGGATGGYANGGATGGAGLGGTSGSGDRGGSTSIGGAPGSGANGGAAGGAGHGGALASGGRGGSTSTGGTSGTGGTTLDCLQGATTPPTSSLITNFSDAMPDPSHAGEYLFGTVSGEPGGTARYASGTIGTFSLSSGELTYGTTVEAPTASDMFPYSGFAVYFNN